MASYRSRLSKNLEKKTIKSLVLSVLGVIVIAGALIKFGVPVLVNFAVIIGGAKSSNELSNKSGGEYISAPVIDALPNATNSAKTAVSGSAIPDETVKLFINDSAYDTTYTDDDGKFLFENVNLTKGVNTISAIIVTKNNKESDPSENITILFKDDPPSLSIENPKDGQSFEKDESAINVAGKTDPQVRITINDYRAVVDSNGNFSYAIKLKEGGNPIIVKATDQAGNITESKVNVSYSP